MQEFVEFFSKSTGLKIIGSLVAVIVIFLIYRLISTFLKRRYRDVEKKMSASSRSATYMRLALNILKYVFIIIAILCVLDINEVDINVLIASIGVSALIGGLILQDFMKDIFRGTAILSDEYFKVGDIVSYKDTVGEVIMLGLRTTRIRDCTDLSVVSIANRGIEEIKVLSDVQFLNIPLPYELSYEESGKVMTDIAEKIEKTPVVDACQYLGVSSLGDSAIEHLLKISAKASVKNQAKRDALCVVLKTLEEGGISLPYNQIDVHFTKNK